VASAGLDDFRAGPELVAFFMNEDPGSVMHAFIARLFPICRSITGDGVRETLRLVQERIPIALQEVPTGTEVFDWSVPKEWNIRDAWVKDSSGNRLIDFREHNLQVVNYSSPVHQQMRLAELKEHLHTLPERPEWIPYRTAYYEENWGFCLCENQLAKFDDNQVYDVCIDASLEDGYLTYGECYLPGEETAEVLISCHVCHPSLANDNLSGIAVAVELARYLAKSPHRYSYRFVFVPGTIGSITWLARNEEVIPNIRHGIVLACVGDAENMSYKRSRQSEAEVDRAFIHVLRHSGDPHAVVEFSPYGYDERQYCSPGINLPVGCLMRSRPGRFAEYHTSADNLEFVQPWALADSLAKCVAALDVLENNRVYVNQKPKGEPQLGKRGLYKALGGNTDRRECELALLWVLNLSDGRHSLLDIAERANLPFALVKDASIALSEADLLIPG
jgi:aminopeptidase-like protein